MAQTPFHIEYHADDYGRFPAQSQRILACSKGLLNGISIFPNSEYLDLAMEMLAEQPPLAITVHLNLMEGRCVSDPAGIPSLATPEGTLRGTFGKLLLRSFLPGRAALRAELRRELSAQIRQILPRLPQGAPLRLDGHAHYHMIPVVFDALMDVLRAEGLKPAYIRLPREYIRLYIATWTKLHHHSAINLVKVAVLNLLTIRAKLRYRRELADMEQRLFLGVFLSGRMDWKNLSPLLPKAEALARKKGMAMEILAHPGGVEEPEDIARITNRGDLQFLTSPMRRAEVSMFFPEKEAN